MNQSATSPRVVVASRNRKKCEEIAELFIPHGITLLGVGDFPNVTEVVEDGLSFAENAAKKATQTAQQVGLWTIGEDSGLTVDALGGRPGIYSARYSGANATDESNNLKLQAELAGIPSEKRTAAYVCSVALADPDGSVVLRTEARCRGRMTTEPRGTNGFGYDPYFLIVEYHQTFGELSASVKRHLSHRARAFEQFIPHLVQLLRVAAGSSR